MSYVPPPVPERWNKGLWDQAHWDGQLGTQPVTGSVVISGNDAAFGFGHILNAESSQIVVTGIDVVMFAALSYPFPVDSGEIVVTAMDAEFSVQHTLIAEADATDIVVDVGKNAALVIGSTIPQPGILQFAIPHVTVPRHW